MKVTCSKDELVSKLGIVARAVSTRTAVQILSGVMLRAEAGELRLAATDMEVSLRSSLEASVEGEGAAVVPGRLLVDLARLLPEGEVVIEHRAEENVVRIECGSASYRLHAFSEEDFPRLPELDSVMAATDSYRLASKETPLSGESPELEAIIPARALAELQRIATSGDTVELGVHENQVIFGSGGVWLTSRRIDGQFPNIGQLVPETFEHDLSVPRAELLDVVRRTSVMAQRNSPLRLRFAEGELTVSAQTQDVGESRETLPVPFSGEPLEIGFNPDFLRDGIESVEGGELTLKLINPLRPGLIQGGGDDFWYLIMPIRLAG